MPFSMYKNLPVNVYFLFIVRLIVTVGNFVYPMVTMYLTQKMHLHEDKAGLVLLFMTVASFIGTALGGLLSDIWSRTRIITVSLFMAGVCYLLVPFCHEPLPVISLIIASMAVYSATLPATNALVADITPVDRRKDAFSLIYIGLTAGYCIAPVLAGFMFTQWPDVLFFIDGTATILGAFVVHFFIKGKTSQAMEKPSEGVKSALNIPTFLKEMFMNPAIVFFCLIFVLHTFIYSQTTFAVPLFLKEINPVKGAILYGWIMAVNSVAVLMLTPILINATRHISPIATCSIAGILFAVGFGIFYVSSSLVVIIAGTVIWSAGEVFSLTNSRVFVADNTCEDNRGRMNTILELLHEAGYGLGPWVMGMVIVKSSVRMVWPILFCTGLLSAALFYVLGVRMRNKQNNVTYGRNQECVR